jgi:hypothetical protein
MPAPDKRDENEQHQATVLSCEVNASSSCTTPQEPIPDLVYDLRDPGGSSDAFYAELATLCDLLVAGIDARAGAVTRAFGEYVQAECKEPPRSAAEYSIDLLTLGLALRRYSGIAEDCPSWAIGLARWLFRLRSSHTRIKPAVDLFRAALTRYFLMPRMSRAPRKEDLPPQRLPRLIAWLQAAGEFEQEIVRIDQWRSFLGTLPRIDAEGCIAIASDLFDWFEQEAEWTLGAYTKGVLGFLGVEYARRGCREDQIFCSKPPVEYHLGMVATEIMNRGLRAEFDRTALRAVLVPTCMRGARAAQCRAHMSGVDMTCTGCDPDCAVNRITRRMRTAGAQLYLVPHSTGFSRWLERWQRAPGVGVVAVACMLNILPGGFEMRERRIASQCVPLDYPGCAKHWRRVAIATGVNEERLVQIAIKIPEGKLAIQSAAAGSSSARMATVSMLR